MKNLTLTTETETDIKFEYELEGAGWSKAYLKIGDTEVVFPAISYLCNPITDLLDGLLCILEEWDMIPRHGKNVKFSSNYASAFTWEDEPDGYKWEFKRYGESQIRVIIKSLYSDDVSDAYCSKKGLDAIVDFKTFLAAILKAIDKLIKDYGLLGFRANWVSSGEEYLQFPLSQFLELKHYLLYGKILYLNKEGTTENWSLNKELQLLNAEIK
jgi:hypothetical protein